MGVDQGHPCEEWLESRVELLGAVCSWTTPPGFVCYFLLFNTRHLTRFIQNHKTNQKSVFFKYKINCIIQRSTVAYKWTLYASALPVQLPCNRIPCLAPRSWVWFVCWQRCFCSYSFFSDSIFSNAWLQMSCPAQMRGHFSTAAPTK